MIREEIPEPRKKGRKKKDRVVEAMEMMEAIERMSDPRFNTTYALEAKSEVCTIPLTMSKTTFLTILKAAAAEDMTPGVWLNRMVLLSAKEVKARSSEWFDS